MHGILSASAGQEQLLTELLVSHAKVSLPGCSSDSHAEPSALAGLVLWAVCNFGIKCWRICCVSGKDV